MYTYYYDIISKKEPFFWNSKKKSKGVRCGSKFWNITRKLKSRCRLLIAK